MQMISDAFSYIIHASDAIWGVQVCNIKYEK